MKSFDHIFTCIICSLNMLDVIKRSDIHEEVTLRFDKNTPEWDKMVRLVESEITFNMELEVVK